MFKTVKKLVPISFSNVRHFSMSKQPEILKRALVLSPKGEHKYTVVFMHGLGDEGASFTDIFQMISLPNTKVILPNAPERSITCNMGYKMPGWYDIVSLDARNLTTQQDEEGILETSNQVMELIDSEVAILGSPKKVFIGGFSQGSAISMFTALRYPQELGGVVGLSGYALLAYKPEFIVTKTTPMMVYHGMQDNVVSINYARESQKFFKDNGVTNIDYSEEPRLAHSISMEEIKKVAMFYKKHME